MCTTVRISTVNVAVAVAMLQLFRFFYCIILYLDVHGTIANIQDNCQPYTEVIILSGMSTEVHHHFRGLNALPPRRLGPYFGGNRMRKGLK